jgi:hypothetical protein
VTLLINPETKIGALLEAYPGVEEVLIAWAPAFAKLRNPILRRTVAKVATIEQAARVGGVSTREMVSKLREATGQPPLEASAFEVMNGAGGGACGGGHSRSFATSGTQPCGTDTPDWVKRDLIRHEIDADSMLERGVHPIGKVRESSASLHPGEIVLLKSSFRPEPLLESMRQRGFTVFCAESSPGRHETFITKA